MTALPWAQIMRFGLGHLRLSPSQFWALTLPELAAALDMNGSATGHPDRDALDALRARYPDNPTEEAKHG